MQTRFIKMPHQIYGSKTTQKWIKYYILLMQAQAFKGAVDIQTHPTHKLKARERIEITST